MISVSDILKILDQWPKWKALTALPERMKALEERIAALEAKPAVKPADACPLCDEPMKTTEVVSHPTFGTFGVQQHTLACTACSHVETRKVDPRKR